MHSFQAKSMGNVWELFGFILESPQEIIVAWRGSISTNDWLSNMNAAQKPFQYIKEPCLTHRGSRIFMHPLGMPFSPCLVLCPRRRRYM